METITFSDNTELSKDNLVEVAESEAVLSLDAYCKRHPDALECREYDV